MAEVIDRCIDTRKALELRLQGLTYSQIGTLLSPSDPHPASSIHSHLRRFEKMVRDADLLPSFAANRAGMLDGLTFQALERLGDSLSDEEKVKKTPIRDLAVTAAVLIDKRRLESGESTANIGVISKLIVESDKDLFGK